MVKLVIEFVVALVKFVLEFVGAVKLGKSLLKTVPSMSLYPLEVWRTTNAF